MARTVGLGIRVRTARAIAVAVGEAPELHVLHRAELSLADPRHRASYQPYHAGLGLEPREAARIVGRAVDAVRSACQLAFHRFVRDLRERDLEIRSVGFVRSSETDPDSVHHPHMHAHAAEGTLFYEALAEAVQTHGFPGFTILESAALPDTAASLSRSEADLGRAIAALGKEVGAPWRTYEKSACAAAWLALGRGRVQRS